MTGGRDPREVLLRSATGAAGMLRRGEISARELVELLFARIDAVDPALNAVVELRREAALRQAAAADEATAAAARRDRCTGSR
jgi:amidase